MDQKPDMIRAKVTLLITILMSPALTAQVPLQVDPFAPDYDAGGEFNFVRVQFDTYYGGGFRGGFGGGTWAIDFPDADMNFAAINRIVVRQPAPMPKVYSIAGGRHRQRDGRHNEDVVYSGRIKTIKVRTGALRSAVTSGRSGRRRTDLPDAHFRIPVAPPIFEGPVAQPRHFLGDPDIVDEPAITRERVVASLIEEFNSNPLIGKGRQVHDARRPARRCR